MARSSRREVAEHHSSAWLPAEVPIGWTLSSLAEVAPVQAGYAFKSSWFSSQGIRLLRGINIVPGGTRWDDEVHLPLARRGEFAPYELSEGDVVLAMDRPVISGGLKVARLRSSDIPALLLQRVARFQPTNAIDPGFLYRFINGEIFFRHIGATATGTQLPHISATDIGTTPVLLPPLNEQKRIVARIDALTEKSREAREALAEIPVLLDKLRQSILAAAFRGDLTREWRAKNPDVEPASVLLERIRQERRKKWEEAQLAKFQAKGKLPKDDSWKKKYVEPQPVDTTDLPDLPEGWCWASLDEIANIETGSTPPGKVAGTYGGTVPFVKPTDLSAGFRVTSARQTLSDLGLAHVTTVRAGSTLLTCIGATIGKAGLARTTCAFNQQINAATSFLGIDDEYLYWALIGPATQAWIVTNASATTLPILNKGRLAKLPVPLCPLKEQKAIATILASTHPSAEQLTQEHTSLANTLLHLDSAILAKAFRGELVPQDPNDEPASVLLERIAAERAAAEPNGKKPRSKRAK